MDVESAPVWTMYIINFVNTEFVLQDGNYVRPAREEYVECAALSTHLLNSVRLCPR
jgi:hypothetical protein